MSWGAFFMAWLKEAREAYPGDLDAQSRYVRRKAIEKRNETTAAASGGRSWSESARDSGDEVQP